VTYYGTYGPSIHEYMIMASKSSKKQNELHVKLQLEAGEPGGSNRSRIQVIRSR